MNSLLRQYYDKINVNYHVLSCNEITHVNHMIETKYIAPKSKFGFSLFDILKVEECVAVNYYDSWRWIYPFINKKSIIVFLIIIMENILNCQTEVFLLIFLMNALNQSFI